MACMHVMVFCLITNPSAEGTFVTRKITRGLANIAWGMEPCLYLGNMNALRDWGHAKDYVRAVDDATARTSRRFRDSYWYSDFSP